MEFVREEGYGGGMIWAVDLDDFNGICNEGKWPLLTAMNIALSGDDDAIVTDVSPPAPVAPAPGTPNQPAVPVPAPIDPLPELENTEVFDVFNCPQAGTFASPDKCNDFYICDTQGVAFAQSCGGGLQFDENLNICNWESNVDCSTRSVNTYSNDNSPAG